MITTMIFDLNQTLVTYGGQGLDKLFLKHFKLSEEEIWSARKKYEPEFTTGKVTEDEYLTNVLNDMKIPLDKLGLIKDLIRQNFNINPRYYRSFRKIKRKV